VHSSTHNPQGEIPKSTVRLLLTHTLYPPHKHQHPTATIVPDRSTRHRLLHLLPRGLVSSAPSSPTRRALSRASTISSEDLHRRCGSPKGGAARTAAAFGSGGVAAFGSGCTGGIDSGEAAEGVVQRAADIPIRVIVAGCTAARRQGLLDGFKQHAPAGSSVVFVHSDGGGGNSIADRQQQAAGAERPQPQPPSPAPAGGSSGGGSSLDDAGAADCLHPEPVTVHDMHALRPVSADALVAAGLADADALVLAACGDCSAPGAATQGADAQLLCELLAIQEALESCRGGIRAATAGGARGLDGSDWGTGVRSGAPGEGSRGSFAGGGRGSSGGVRRELHVVCLVRSYGMRRTAQAFLRSMLTRRLFSFELLIADELVAAALVQVGVALVRVAQWGLGVSVQRSGGVWVDDHYQLLTPVYSTPTLCFRITNQTKPSPLPSPPAFPQIATHPHNSQVFDRLLLQHRGSTQLTMQPASQYGFGGGTAAAFGAVAEAAMRASRVVALGYRKADGRMLLAPAAADVVEWDEGDELVVIADEDAPPLT